MMPALLAGNSIGIVVGSWENPLPWPFSTRVRVFALQRVQHCNVTKSFLDIFMMLTSNRFDMFRQRFFDRCRQHRVTIFIPFTCSDDDLVARKIDILDPEMAAFHQSQTTTV